jgi:hypothetical protein
MNADELARRAHQEWLGYLQPSGLVVSPPALVAAQAFPQKNIVPEQQRLLEVVAETEPPAIDDFPRFAREFLGWDAADLAGGPEGPELPDTLTIALPEYGESLRPRFAVPDPDNPSTWLLLIGIESSARDLDATPDGKNERWNASAQLRFERLLRETGVPSGILTNGTHLRLVYAPRGESSGFITFPVAAMCEVAGRPIVAALHMLLSAERLFTVASNQRLPAILRESRKYQNEVSTRLAGQVLAALYELLRGFQAADEATKGGLLRDVLREAPQDVYGGLLGTLMRLVFVLYAEDRALLSDDPVYQEHYSVGRLFERLRDDHARYPDTMKDRFGAWAQLLTLFRLIHDGAAHGTLRLPARHGRLFNPDTWDFLEGRAYGDVLDRSRRLTPPRVSDGVVYRVLENLIVLDGERISYRALDVEQIGSVYEAMMGFELRVASGPSIAVRPDHVVVDLAELLAAKPADRVKNLAEDAGCKLTGKAGDAVKNARTIEDLVAALNKRISKLMSQPVPKGGLLLQPTDERRRSGSHYTPRSLTAPIVQTTLDPILKNLGEKPTPEQILALKVCDPAMGSGAFLVEACRYLGDALVASWQAHGQTPPIPADEDPFMHARRLVASRCLYGTDKNVFAVDLAKLSLWLATLAKDHPFTFLDHALRNGDSLVGLTREQIASFHWNPGKQIPFIRPYLTAQLKEAEDLRRRLLALGDEGDLGQKARLHEDAVRALRDLRLCADLVIAAFFGKEKDKDRETLRLVYEDQIKAVLEDQQPAQRLDEIVAELYRPPRPVPPFHWEIEFPEVFSRDNPGFDAFVGNPPFLGGKRISTILGNAYRDWLAVLDDDATSNTDLIAHFFRRAFTKMRAAGTFGLIATNTIAQGDTRAGGLRWICTHGGTIYTARKRVKWPSPGAAVIVSVVHMAREAQPRPLILDGLEVERITAFLFHEGGNEDPARLRANADKSFIGSLVLGMGFTFDDDTREASPLAEMERLIAKDRRNKERIFPYIGGEEVNDSPTHDHRRYVINFEEMTEAEARSWPDLMAIIEARVWPERRSKPGSYSSQWWLFGRRNLAGTQAIRCLDRVLVNAQVSSYILFAEQPTNRIFAHTLNIFALPPAPAIAVLQSRVHELWARFFGSSLEERFRYTPSDCFETFPFPPAWDSDDRLRLTGGIYHSFRADLMVRNSEGLTKTYNRFHDPEERNPDILRLRELHDAMDRAVLDAYGWGDLQPKCEFLLEYEDEDSADEVRPSKRKKPWRYRWPDALRDEVLARLLVLNQECAREEALSACLGAGVAGIRRAPGGGAIIR